MLKRTKNLIILILVLALSSCSKDDPKPEEHSLAGAWKVKSVNTFTFFEEELVKTDKEVFDTAPFRILTLKSDGSATYQTPEYNEVFSGEWGLEEENFWTNVHIEPGVVSSGPIYFFPASHVVELTASQLVLKSDTLWTQDQEGKRYSYFTETSFEK